MESIRNVNRTPQTLTLNFRPVDRVTRLFHTTVKIHQKGTEIEVRQDELIAALINHRFQTLKELADQEPNAQKLIKFSNKAQKILKNKLIKAFKEAKNHDPTKTTELVQALITSDKNISVDSYKKALENVQALANEVDLAYHKLASAHPKLTMTTDLSFGEPVTEVSERIPTLDKLKEAYEAEEIHLMKAWGQETSPTKQTALLARLSHVRALKKELDDATKRGLTWVGADQYREDASRVAAGLSPYEQPPYVPAVVNLRTHRLEGPSGAFKFVRSGALTDPTEGGTYLSETSSPTRKRRLQDQMLQLLTTHLEEHAEALEDPKSVINQSGQFVMGQVSLLDPSRNKNRSKEGFVHNERNQMLDMDALFDTFQGYTLVFDGSGPFVEEGQKKIYLPQKFTKDSGQPRTLTLQTVFFNVSVQGLKSNTGEQRDINLKNLAKLEELLDQASTDKPYAKYLYGKLGGNKGGLAKLKRRLKTVKKQMEKNKKSNYAVAKELALIFSDMQAGVGINCFSGKDRTGYLMILLMMDGFKKTLGLTHLSDKAKSSLKSQFKAKMYAKDGIAMQVVRQNTQFLLLKIQEVFLKGMSTLDRIGMAIRAKSAKS